MEIRRFQRKTLKQLLQIMPSAKQTAVSYSEITWKLFSALPFKLVLVFSISSKWMQIRCIVLRREGGRFVQKWPQFYSLIKWQEAQEQWRRKSNETELCSMGQMYTEAFLRESTVCKMATATENLQTWRGLLRHRSLEKKKSQLPWRCTPWFPMILYSCLQLGENMYFLGSAIR